MSAFWPALSLIFCMALGGELPFDPEWKDTIPFDAFSIKDKREWKTISITSEIPPKSKDPLEEGSETAVAAAGAGTASAADTAGAEDSVPEEPVTISLKLHKTNSGLLSAFPIWDGESFFQAEFLFDGAVETGQITGLTITNTIAAGGNGENGAAQEGKNGVEAAGGGVDGGSEAAGGGVDGAVESKSAAEEAAVLWKGADAKIDFIEFIDSEYFLEEDKARGQKLPAAARVNISGTNYYVSFSWTPQEVIETWFSESGEALFLFKLYTREESPFKWQRIERLIDDSNEAVSYSYDSFGNKIISLFPSGSYIARYNDSGPVYLSAIDTKDNKNRLEQIEVQRDARSVITRSKKISANAPQIDFPERAVSENKIESFSEYKYKFDAAGNWITRTETLFKEKFGMLVPVRSTHSTRKISY